jgi:hypothetical protein
MEATKRRETSKSFPRFNESRSPRNIQKTEEPTFKEKSVCDEVNVI